MQGQKLYQFSRATHRIVLFAVSFLIIVMSITGTILKYPTVGDWLRLDSGMVRYVHNQLSPYLTITLAIMMLTGIVMYVYPWYRKRKAIRATDTHVVPGPPAQNAQQ